jgi:hypothetical protein
MISLFPVQSSMIAAAGYDSRAHVLVVLYNTGKAYEYHYVPPDIFWELMAAESKGRFMNREVLGRFPYRVFHGWNLQEDDDLQYGRRASRERIPERRSRYPVS